MPFPCRAASDGRQSSCAGAPSGSSGDETYISDLSLLPEEETDLDDCVSEADRFREAPDAVSPGGSEGGSFEPFPKRAAGGGRQSSGACPSLESSDDKSSTSELGLVKKDEPDLEGCAADAGRFGFEGCCLSRAFEPRVTGGVARSSSMLLSSGPAEDEAGADFPVRLAGALTRNGTCCPR